MAKYSSPRSAVVMTDTISNILSEVSRISPYYVPEPFPKPYIGRNIKAILLGADPGTWNGQRFTYVFRLEDGEESRYFQQFILNLQAIELSLENLYVQNLCRNYFDRDTLSHKEDWLQCAQYWTGPLREELDEFDPDKTLPVLVSAYVILEALCLTPCRSPDSYYVNGVFVQKNQNCLHRTVIPFFRGGAGKYLLSKPKWTRFTEKIKSHVARNSAEQHPQQ